MKKIIIAGVCILLAFASCSKKNSNPSFHLSFKVNGTQVNYTGYVIAHLEVGSGYSTLTILGAETASSYDNYFGFYLDNDPGMGQIVSGEYQDDNTNFSLLATYQKNSSEEYEAGQSVAEDAVYYNITFTHFKVTISSIGGTAVKGTFSGDFFQGGDVENGTKISITNGDFYAQLL